MTRERFDEILKEYGFTDRQLDLIWASRPTDDLIEDRLRFAATMTLLEEAKENGSVN